MNIDLFNADCLELMELMIPDKSIDLVLCDLPYGTTQKPVELMEYFIQTYTNEGMTILDNCMGSGTTGIACKKLNRNFIGIEKDPEYFKLAERRINETV